MQELNAKWVETNEKLDRMLARMDGMDKNMSEMCIRDSNNNREAGILPIYVLIEKVLLFGTAFMQINAGSLNTLMSENVGQERNIITFLYKIFGKQMSECMGMYDR